MKKTFIIIISVVSVLIFLALVYIFITNQLGEKEGEVINEGQVYYPTAQEAARWDRVMPQEELLIEYLDDEEAIELGLSTSTDMQLQVIQRGEEGEVLEYKKIKSEQDLIRYKY